MNFFLVFIGGGIGSVLRYAVGLCIGAAALPPKAFSGSSIKSSVPALEAFVDDRMSSK
jgi:hypothetical protein